MLCIPSGPNIIESHKLSNTQRRKASPCSYDGDRVGVCVVSGSSQGDHLIPGVVCQRQVLEPKLYDHGKTSDNINRSK